MTTVTTEERLTRIEERQDATNQRMDDLKSGLEARINDTNHRIDDLKSSLETRIDDLKSSLETRIDDLKYALEGRINDTNQRVTEMNQKIDKLIFTMFGIGALTIATLITTIIGLVK